VGSIAAAIEADIGGRDPCQSVLLFEETGICIRNVFMKVLASDRFRAQPQISFEDACGSVCTRGNFCKTFFESKSPSNPFASVSPTFTIYKSC
jgi:hypothetical protein